MKICIDFPDERATEQMAGRMAACLVAPLVLTFSGEIGAGKTTFIRAMLRAFGVRSAIKSPTFSLVESYQSNCLQIHHFDLYRIHDAQELDYIGFRDYFAENAVCCIEWPQRITLDKVDIAFRLALKGAGRELHADALSAAGVEILRCVQP